MAFAKIASEVLAWMFQVLMNPKDSQGKEITWKSSAALEGYVKRLNDVAERLAEKTRQLRKWHDVMREKVIIDNLGNYSAIKTISNTRV